MQIDINNPNQILSHFLLKNCSICEEVSNSPEWKDGKLLTASVFVNGIEIPAQDFEDTLQELFEQVENNIKAKYDVPAIDEMVEGRARSLLREHASNALEKLQEFSDTLEQVELSIKPHWER